jgi:hypothetical protein
VFAYSNGVALLFYSRIRQSFRQPLFRLVKSHSSRAHIAMHMYFSIGASGNFHVARSIKQFHSRMPSRGKISIEPAAHCGSGLATGQQYARARRHGPKCQSRKRMLKMDAHAISSAKRQRRPICS